MNFKLDHINLSVRDLEESLQWYENAFDFKFLEGERTHPQEPWAIAGKDDVMVCLYEDKALKAADVTDSPFHRIYHFGLRVSDREAWEKRVKELNLRVQYGGAYKYPRSVSWYVFDPSGHEIEVSFANNGPLRF